MSKYESLCAEYHAALSRFNQYADDCYHFAEEFFAALREYFDCPEDAVRFYAPQDELDTTQGCPLRDAMFHNPDGFYTAYFSLTLKLPAAQDTVLAAVRIKKIDNRFTIKIGMSRKEFEVAEKPDMIQAFDYIFTGVKAYYQKDGFIKSSASPIGFAV